MKGVLGLEAGEGGGLGKNDVWFALRGETTITLSGFELAPTEKKQLIAISNNHSITNTDGQVSYYGYFATRNTSLPGLPRGIYQISLIFPIGSHFYI